MGTATRLLVNSKFFLPTFSMAIFDGPFRLYFEPTQESEALRLYCELHEILGEKVRLNASAYRNRSLFVLMYPCEETFQNAFGTDGALDETWLGDQLVVGVKGPVWDESVLRLLLARIDDLFHEIGQEQTFEAQSV